MQFKKIKGFGKYEISESGTTIRNVKTKAIVSLDKGASVRLINDADERITINKKDFAEQLVGEGESIEVDITGQEDVAQQIVDAIEKVKEEVKEENKTETQTEEKTETNNTNQKQKTMAKAKTKTEKKAPVKGEKKKGRTGSLISEIRAYFEKGKDHLYVIAKTDAEGKVKYNPSTVRVQWGKYKKENKIK